MKPHGAPIFAAAVPDSNVSPKSRAACDWLAGITNSPTKAHKPSRTAELLIIGCIPFSRNVTSPIHRLVQAQPQLPAAETLSRPCDKLSTTRGANPPESLYPLVK